MGRLSTARRRLSIGVALLFLAACFAVGWGVRETVLDATQLRALSLRAGFAAACATLVVLGLVAVVLAMVERRRRTRIEALAERVDLIVRDTQSVQTFEDYEEGELALLANELQKVCVILRDQAQALRGERDSLADSLADISHQLRTPLMSLNLTLELLGKPDITPARRRELVRELKRVSDHMGWLVTSLLTLARADAGMLQLTCASVSVADLVEEAVGPLRIAAELAGQELEVCLQTGTERFEGDCGWSKEALANVVKNCMEHTPAGGRVRIEASQDAVATRIVVTDTGPGIDPRDLPHLFERFYKGGGSSASSVGIGLALARCLVVAQGGTLGAANGVRGGARFTMTFPHIDAL